MLLSYPSVIPSLTKAIQCHYDEHSALQVYYDLVLPPLHLTYYDVLY